jgi:2-octaprenyl-6-methoxyphenol hydroxylase
MQLADEEFCRRLSALFGPALGAFSSPRARCAYRLRLKQAAEPAGSRTVLIGKAAQTLHPVAGQGFNLGLRDAWELGSLASAHAGDVGGKAMLARYGARRRVDRRGAIAWTDGLIRLFCNDNPILNQARSAGLALFDALPPAKDFLARRMMFGARG